VGRVQLREYEKRTKAAAEAEELRRKTLESEGKKLRAEMAAAADACNARVAEVALRRLACDAEVAPCPRCCRHHALSPPPRRLSVGMVQSDCQRFAAAGIAP